MLSRVIALLLPLLLCGSALAETPSTPPVRVSLEVSDPTKPLLLTAHLENVSAKKIDLYTHIKTHELHFDFFEIKLRFPTPSREGCGGRHVGTSTRTLRFVDDRDKSYPVKVTLKPGQRVGYPLDLTDWSGRRINGSKVIGPGFYQAMLVYEVRGAKDAWNGKTKSPSAKITVPGKIVGSKCKKNPGWQYW